MSGPATWCRTSGRPRRSAWVVAHDEGDVALVPVAPSKVGDVHARDGGRRDVPRCGDGPVPTVEQLSSQVADALRLLLRQRRARRDGCDLAGSESLVETHPVDVDGVRRRVRVDLEVDPLADVDRDVGREALDRVVAGSRDVPDVRRGAGLGVVATISLPPGAHGSAAMAGFTPRVTSTSCPARRSASTRALSQGLDHHFGPCHPCACLPSPNRTTPTGSPRSRSRAVGRLGTDPPDPPHRSGWLGGQFPNLVEPAAPRSSASRAVVDLPGWTGTSIQVQRPLR